MIVALRGEKEDRKIENKNKVRKLSERNINFNGRKRRKKKNIKNKYKLICGFVYSSAIHNTGTEKGSPVAEHCSIHPQWMLCSV